MNDDQKARLQRVTDWLAAGAPHVQLNENLSLDGFSYGEWVKEIPNDSNACGTLACIAGALVEFEYAGDMTVIYRKVFIKGELSGSISDLAGELTGLTYDQRGMLFFPFDLHLEDLCEGNDFNEDDFEKADFSDGGDPPLDWVRDLPPQQIATVLQHFIDTGKIEWLRVYPSVVEGAE